MDIPTLFAGTFVFIFGLVFGSFLNVLIARWPRDLSVVSPPSSCPRCHARIRFYDNIPVLSWIILKAKCRSCGAQISIVYPLVELTVGLLFLALFAKHGLDIYFLKHALFVFLLLGAGYSDLFTALDKDFECGIIPDQFTLGGIGAGLVFSFWTMPGIKGALLGGAVGFLALYIPALLFRVFAKKEGMGGGDIKLMAMTGVFLGAFPIYFVVLISALIGVAVGLPSVILMKNRNYMIPYGPFISAAAIVYIFYNRLLIQWFTAFVQ
ncbi:prepilin peptidase [Limisalsivibrio acetivorans]|uniref:prepilin peptidase n=1 Tax=Limisalsivibrio acetivorans TaxID=1304888 RepID=UPI0003B6E449|nr:A24 family peptidase [Limisalsivibrio acetivorans]